MSATSRNALPTRSEIENWEIDNLDRAASEWRQISDHSEESFDQYRAMIINTDWSGDAKDAAVAKATAAVRVVSNQNHIIRDSATIAENGRSDVKAAKQAAVTAIADAEADGFKVGEDLSVTDTRRVDISSMSARLTAATEHAEDIRWNAEQLLQTDTLIGKRLSANAAELDAIHFDDESGNESGMGFQTVGFKEAPIPDPGLPGDPVGPGGGPTAAEIRGVLGRLPTGAPGVSEVSSVQELERLWKWLEQNGTERPGGYGPDPSRGTWKELPDGTRVGHRNAAKSTSNPALDIKIPGDKGNLKVHVNPSRGGTVTIPTPTVPEPVPKPAAPSSPPVEPKPPAHPIRGGTPVMGGVAEPPVPWPVRPPGHGAGDPDLPVKGDGIPDDPHT